MSAVNAFLMECAASPDSPFPATTLSTASRQMAGLPRNRRASDGEAVDDEMDMMHTPPTLARKGELLREDARVHGPTPPSNGSVHSNTSRVSYNSVSSKSSNLLTDSSTLASGGSTARTPDTGGQDSAVGADLGRKLYGSGLGKGTSSRAFNRTASAPVGKTVSHMRDYEGKMLVKEDIVEIVGEGSPSLDSGRRDEVSAVSGINGPIVEAKQNCDLWSQSGNISTTVTLSAAAPRPTLQHTSSASSLNSSSTADKVEAYKTPNLTSRYQTARSTDRTKLLSRSTLKGFGGPVKRSQAVLPSEDEDVEQSETSALPDLGERPDMRRAEREVPTLRSTTPYGEPPSHNSMAPARTSPPRSTTPLSSTTMLPAPAESSSSRYRSSPPRRTLESIPDTIPEAAEIPLSRDSYLDINQQGVRSSHARSASISPDVNAASRTATAYARHRHSPSVPIGRDYAEQEKENRQPRGQQVVEKSINGNHVAPPPPAPHQHALREGIADRSRTPDREQRTFAREIDMQNVESSRSSSTLRAEPIEAPMASSSAVTPRAMHSYAPPQPEPQEMLLNHPDPYGAPHSVVPMYMTPAQTGPIRQANDYGALQTNRTAPPVPSQNYYTDMAAATPASTLPPGRKGLIVSILISFDHLSES